MTRERYIQLTNGTRQILAYLHIGEKLLRLPTLILAFAYLGVGLSLLLCLDKHIFPYLLSPAICFIAVTALRNKVNRPRPYDALGFSPVGKYIPGKGRSMPSRHAASAVAILIALLMLHPALPAGILLTLLTLFICILRVVTGMHYPSDVLAGICLSIILSLILFPLISSLLV